MASREVAIFFFFLISFFIDWNAQGEKVFKKKSIENMKKKVPFGPF